MAAKKQTLFFIDQFVNPYVGIESRLFKLLEQLPADGFLPRLLVLQYASFIRETTMPCLVDVLGRLRYTHLYRGFLSQPLPRHAIAITVNGGYRHFTTSHGPFCAVMACPPLFISPRTLLAIVFAKRLRGRLTATSENSAELMLKGVSGLIGQQSGGVGRLVQGSS